MESLEEKVEGLITGDVSIIEDGELMKPAAGGSCFELHVGAGADSTLPLIHPESLVGNLCAACAYGV